MVYRRYYYVVSYEDQLKTKKTILYRGPEVSMRLILSDFKAIGT